MVCAPEHAESGRVRSHAAARTCNARRPGSAAPARSGAARSHEPALHDRRDRQDMLQPARARRQGRGQQVGMRCGARCVAAAGHGAPAQHMHACRRPGTHPLLLCLLNALMHSVTMTWIAKKHRVPIQ